MLKINEFCKKSHSSKTHFAEIVNNFCFGKFEFGQCLKNNNKEILKKEVRNFQRLPNSIRLSCSNSNKNFINQTFIPTNRRFNDPLQEAKNGEKIKLKYN